MSLPIRSKRNVQNKFVSNRRGEPGLNFMKNLKWIHVSDKHLYGSTVLLVNPVSTSSSTPVLNRPTSAASSNTIMKLSAFANASASAQPVISLSSDVRLSTSASSTSSAAAIAPISTNKTVGHLTAGKFGKVAGKPKPSKRTFSQAWDFMGYIVQEDTNTLLNPECVYCKFCFDYEKIRNSPMFSKVYTTSDTTSTGNWLQHAAKIHDFVPGDDNGEVTNKQRKLEPWLDKIKIEASSSTQWEFNRDLGLMICRDLLPFDIVEKPGFSDFIKRNCQFETPTANTLSTTVLNDIYVVLKEKVKHLLSDICSATVMMDGWTDRHNALPYFAIRLSSIINWKFTIVTLAVLPVESHTATMLEKFVKETIKKFVGEDDYKKIKFFNTTDGAANMIKLSKNLSHDRNTCVAHSLHNLLTVDAMDKIANIQQVVNKCKEAVSTLHFKSYMLHDEKLKEKDKELIESTVITKVTELHDMVEASESQMSADQLEELECGDDSNAEKSNVDTLAIGVDSNHHYRRLQKSVPTRWNSIYTMISSILDLYDPVNEVLKKLGRYNMCFDGEDKELLTDLKEFLNPFLQFTLLFSQNSPTISLVPLVISRIEAMCVPNAEDSATMKQLKRLTLQVRTHSVSDYYYHYQYISALYCTCAAISKEVLGKVLFLYTILSFNLLYVPFVLYLTVLKKASSND